MDTLVDTDLELAISRYNELKNSYFTYKTNHPEARPIRFDMLNESNIDVANKIIELGNRALLMKNQGDTVCKKALKLAFRAIKKRPNIATLKSVKRYDKNSLSWEYLLIKLRFASNIYSNTSLVVERRWEQFLSFYIREVTKTDRYSYT